MDRETRLKRLQFRSHHRGTREADMMIGGFFDAYATGWDEAELGWFEALLEEQDADIIAWGLKTAKAPTRWNGPQMAAFQQLDFIALPND